MRDALPITLMVLWIATAGIAAMTYEDAAAARAENEKIRRELTELRAAKSDVNFADYLVHRALTLPGGRMSGKAPTP
jgi:hypothetical protein